MRMYFLCVFEPLYSVRIDLNRLVNTGTVNYLPFEWLKTGEYNRIQNSFLS